MYWKEKKINCKGGKSIIKVLTALGNENLNNCLRGDSEFDVLEKDIFYKEGILEYLEKKPKVDILILYEKLNGEIQINDLIKNIKKINNEINIFFILENKNENLENLLKMENIKNIFYNDEININNFIIKLKNTKINNEEKLKQEIENLKNIINKKDEELLKLTNKKLEINENKKTIVITGIKNSGKSSVLSNLEEVLKNRFDFLEIDINNFLEIEKINNYVYKYIFVIENKLEKIKINRVIIKKLILKNKINLRKINIIFTKKEKNSINKKIIENIFKDFKIIGNIKYNYYFFNKKNNNLKENKKFKKEYLKIIEKI